MLVALGQENDPLSEPFSCRSAAPFPMLSFVPLTVAQRMPTPAPGCDCSPDPAPAEQCQQSSS